MKAIEFALLLQLEGIRHHRSIHALAPLTKSNERGNDFLRRIDRAFDFSLHDNLSAAQGDVHAGKPFELAHVFIACAEQILNGRALRGAPHVF